MDSRPPESPAAARVSGAADAASPPPPSFAAHLEWLLLLTAVAVVVLVYPLALDEYHQAAWGGFWSRHPGAVTGWMTTQLGPFLGFLFSPLILKGVVAGVAMLAFLAVFAMRRLLGGWGPGESAGDWWWGWAAFFLWTAASGFWGPTPPVSHDAAAWAALYGLFGWAILRRGFGAAELRQLALLLALMGAATLAVLGLEALPAFNGWIFQFMHRFADARNTFGSILGHNTAAASYLMMTAFPALALALSAGNRAWRWLGLFYLVLVLGGVVILQSRSVWVLGAALGFFAVRSMTRAAAPAARRWVATLLIAAATLGVVSQTIASTWNPFYVGGRGKSFGERVHDLGYAVIRGDARARLNWIGMRLVPDHPFVGSGLYTFQYLYPAAQGDYVWNHQDTKLRPPLERSNVAHDEYLQVAVEEGLVGLLLLGWMLIEIARRGWRTRAAPGTDGDARLLHEAFGWSGLGFALHACFDFPFHIPQLGLPGLVCLAAWASFAPRRDSEPFPAAPVFAANDKDEAPRRFRPARFARVLGALVCLELVPFAALPFARALQGDFFYNLGNSFSVSLQPPYDANLSPRQRLDRIVWTVQTLEKAVETTPSNGLAWQRLGDAYRVFAQTFMGAGDAAAQLPAESRDRALAALKKAQGSLDRAASLVSYDLVPYYRALVDWDEALLEPGRGHEEAYRRDLLRTLQYSPNNIEAATRLDRNLMNDFAANEALILKVRRLILRFDTALFDREYVFPASRAFQDQRYAEAFIQWDRLTRVNPIDPYWASMAALTGLYAGEDARALAYVTLLHTLDPAAATHSDVGIVEAALKKDWAAMAAEVADHLDVRLRGADARRQAYYAAIEIAAGERLAAAPARRVARPADLADDAWRRLQLEEELEVRLHFTRDLAGARRAAEARLALPGAPPGARFHVEAAYLGLAQHDDAFARAACERARAADPRHPALADLAARLSLPAQR